MHSYQVGVLGATGAVGQKFIRLLENHPWFTAKVLGASKRWQEIQTGRPLDRKNRTALDYRRTYRSRMRSRQF